MLSFKMKHSLYSVLIVFCVSHAFDKFGATSDSSPTIRIGLGLDVARSQERARPGFVSDDLEARQSRSELNQRTSSEVSATDNVQNRSSELNDLFAVGSGSPKPEYNSSIPSSSKAKLVVLEGGSTVKTDQIRTSLPGIINVSLNGTSNRPMSMPALSTGLDLLPTNSNTSTVVPSEGGVLQDGLSHIPTKSVALEVMSTSPMEASEIDVKDGKDTKVELDRSQGLPTRERVSSIVSKQIESQDSHISARKGANLSEQTESANGTMVPLTFKSTSFEIKLDPNLHTPKITPRKGAELPKIFPRKGVDEQFMNPNSDQFSSDMNNNTKTTVPVSASTTRPTGNPKDIVKHINTSKAGRPSLQNDSTIIEKTSTQSVNSESSISPTSSSSAMEDVSTKTESTSDVAATNSNSTLNVNMSSHNVTLDKLVVDKSGIIASYPPLKKRPKPLKTTDLHSVNISPITTEHSSSEHDYVIPIVVTILTVPMLVVLVLFLYKKGSEFWERRHYRRMDFLIDGMYND